MMGGAVQDGLGKVDVLKIEFIRGFAMSVVEIHAHVPFPDRAGDVPLPFEHLGKGGQRTVNHR